MTESNDNGSRLTDLEDGSRPRDESVLRSVKIYRTSHGARQNAVEGREIRPQDGT